VIHQSLSLKYEPSSELLHSSPRTPHRRSLVSNAAHPPVQRLLDIHIQDIFRTYSGHIHIQDIFGTYSGHSFSGHIQDIFRTFIFRTSSGHSPPLQGYLGNENLVRAIIFYKYSGSMKITTHLDHISHCKTASGTNWSNRWTSRVFIINTHRD